MVAVRRAFHGFGFSHADLGAQTFCRKNSSDVVSCDAGCLVVHKPMKYDPGAIVVGVGHPGTGSGTALRTLLGILKLTNKPGAACDADALLSGSPQSSAPLCKVIVGLADVEKIASIAHRYPRAKFVHTVSSRPCPDERNFHAQLSSNLDRDRIFPLDLTAAAPADWRRFCAFLEIWSSCKSHDLAKIAGGWKIARRRVDKSQQC